MFLTFYFQTLLPVLFQEKGDTRLKLAKIHPKILVQKATMLEPLKPIT